LLADLASGNQVDAGIGDISPSVPVTVCGNAVGALGDASASCGTAQPGSANGGSGGGLTVGTSGSTQADGTLAGNQVDANLDDVSATVPVTASCNSVGLLGDAASNCGTTNPDPSTDTSADVALTVGSSGTDPTTADVDLTIGTSGPSTDTSADVDLTVGTSDLSTGADIGTFGIGTFGIGTFGIDTFGIDTGTVTGPGTDAGIGIDAGTETSTGGTIAPPPGTTSSGGTGADGTPGSSTGTSGIPGTLGLAPASGDADSSVTSFAPLRPSVAGSGALPFTGAASDLLALAAFGLLVAGALVVRATRPAAAREGGDDR
jgi:hypothetical protein